NNERKFLKAPNANVSVVARLNGDIHEKALRNALDKVQKVHPLLSAKVVIDENNIAWFYVDDTVPEIPLKVVSRKSDKDFFKIIQEEHRIPWNIYKGPLIRFILVHSPTVSDLIVFCLHTICDGTALANLLRDVLTFLSDPETPVNPILPPKLDFSFSKSKIKKALMKRIYNIINKKWQKDPIIIEDEQVFSKLHSAFWNKNTYDVLLLELSKKQTEDLNKHCRELGTTINSALNIAYYVAYQKVFGIFGKKQRNIVIPYDLRTRLDANVENVFSLFVGSINLDFKYNFKAPFWNNVQHFHKMVVKKIQSFEMFSSATKLENLDPTLIETFMTFIVLNEIKPTTDPKLLQLDLLSKNEKNLAVKIANKFNNSLPGTVITNLGRLKIPESFGNLTLERMYFISGAGRSIPLVISALGASGKLTLALNVIEEKGKLTPRMTKMKEVNDYAVKLLEIK
ncbi:MAG: condensation domain-containing protein, partial [Candidatus Thorarchaeota archaeon]